MSSSPEVVRVWSTYEPHPHLPSRTIQYFVGDDWPRFLRLLQGVSFLNTCGVQSRRQFNERLLVIQPAVQVFAEAVRGIPGTRVYWRQDATPVAVSVILPSDRDDEQERVFAAELAMLDALPPASVRVAVHYAGFQLPEDYQAFP